MKGAVASGHRLTSAAACEALEKGGNAFDAVVAAAFASLAAEPTLTSLGGGGFLLIHERKTCRDLLVDFFVNTPGLGRTNLCAPVMAPADVAFISTVQRFHVGLGSVAVPGTMKGLAHCYERFCTMDLADLLRPALRVLDEGVEISGTMAYLFGILGPILTREPYGREIFSLKEGERYFNPLLRDFLSTGEPAKWLAAVYGHEGFTEWEHACLLTPEDFRQYRVEEREPLAFPYREFDILTNPPPSFGGILLRLTFGLLNEFDIAAMNDRDRYDLIATVMKAIREMREEPAGGTSPRFPLSRDLIRRARGELDRTLSGDLPVSTRGTTHISVIDGDGNAASLTASNGSNSGCFLGDTGIMLNNMMGEDDLHPHGFYTLPPGRRVSSMMSPSFIRRNGSIVAVLGSGGSKRIRTAIPQVVVNLLDRKIDVRDAVESPRLHYDDEGVLQAEPGFDPEVIEHLRRYFRMNIWDAKDMHFGGVHTVLHDLTGHGDSRRGGCFMKV